MFGAGFFLVAVLNLAEWEFSLGDSGRLFGFILELFCAHRVNLDYYMYKVRGETMWKFAKPLDNAGLAWFAACLGVIALVGSITVIPSSCGDKAVMHIVETSIEQALKQKLDPEAVALVSNPTTAKRDIASFTNQCFADLSVVHGIKEKTYRVHYETISGDVPLTFRVRIENIIPR